MSLQEIPCLKVEDKYARMIIKGIKDWEIRRVKTAYRGPLAIGSTKTKTVLGYVDLANCMVCRTSMLASDVFENRHHASDYVLKYAQGNLISTSGMRDWLCVYVLDNPRREALPYPYTFSTGSWCKAGEKYRLSLERKVDI